MKFPRIIALSLFSLFSAGTTMAIAEINDTSVDRTFTIEDIAGDPKYIEDIKFQNIIKTDLDSFEKVVFGKSGADFEKTVYDTEASADEKILDNKELYRGTFIPAEFENDQYMITADFNGDYPYTSQEAYAMIAIKDKQTRKVTKEKIAVSDFTSSEQVYTQTLMEKEGKIYYAFFGFTNNDNKSTLYIYEVDPHSVQLKEVMRPDATISSDYMSSYTNISVADGKLYSVLYNESRHVRLLIADPAKKTSEQKELFLDVDIDDYIDSVSVIDEYLYIQVSGSTHIFNIKTLETIAIVQSKIKEMMDYVICTELKVKKGLLYIVYEGFKNDTSGEYIGVYDNKTGNLLYEGKLPSMDGRGVNVTHTFVE